MKGEYYKPILESVKHVRDKDGQGLVIAISILSVLQV